MQHLETRLKRTKSLAARSRPEPQPGTLAVTAKASSSVDMKQFPAKDINKCITQQSTYVNFKLYHPGECLRLWLSEEYLSLLRKTENGWITVQDHHLQRRMTAIHPDQHYREQKAVISQCFDNANGFYLADRGHKSCGFSVFLLCVEPHFTIAKIILLLCLTALKKFVC